jgi:CheY-like chemotaxis protein
VGLVSSDSDLSRSPAILGPGPVLVVEDDGDIREALAETLQNLGFHVVTAANGRDALTLLRQLAAPPSVILLDLMMPVLDGYGFLEERRKSPELAAIPVVIVTAGYNADRDRLGVGQLILRKPLDMPQLMGILRDLGTS